MTTDNREDLGKIIQQRRLLIPLTRLEMAARSGISESHIFRIERGERLPAARVLRKIAKALDFNERELFIRVGYLSPEDSASESMTTAGLDPDIGRVLASEPVEVQRTVIGILSILKNMAKGINCSEDILKRQSEGRIIKQRRLLISLTRHELAAKSGISESYIFGIERGERLPSARILRKIAKALDFTELELFIRVGYLSPEDSASESMTTAGLDPDIGRVLASEPVEVQRTVIGILSILKNMAKGNGCNIGLGEE